MEPGIRAATSLISVAGCKSDRGEFDVFRLPLIGAPQGGILFKTFDTKVMYRFLDLLIGHFVHVIHLRVGVDHCAHRSSTVRARLVDHAYRNKLHFTIRGGLSVIRTRCIYERRGLRYVFRETVSAVQRFESTPLGRKSRRS
ncbi:hypothetical protein ACWD62_35065 [Streptomyces sp. NPDC005146]